MIHNFDDIRPYIDTEIPAAMKRIAESEYLPAICKFVFPEKKIDEVQQMLLSYRDIRDFQVGVMYQFNQQVITQTINKFTYTGTDYLKPENFLS